MKRVKVRVKIVQYNPGQVVLVNTVVQLAQLIIIQYGAVPLVLV